MIKLKSYFELENGDIIRHSEIRYINKPFLTIELFGGRVIQFNKDAINDFLKCIDEYKKFRDILDEYESLKISKEIIVLRKFSEAEIDLLLQKYKDSETNQ